MRILPAVCLWLLAGPALAKEHAVKVALEIEAEPFSKKAAFLREKFERPSWRAKRLPRFGMLQSELVTLKNVWTEDVVAVDPHRPPKPATFDQLTRCHYTQQSALMDGRLFPLVLKAAVHFRARYVEIVSGFRAPKYQLMLRKKGHEVARDSEHPRGQAVDFRLPGIATKLLLRFIKAQHLGGVGYYPESSFVHADVGRVRFWKGH
jgi:uncharacterized protein YcbK (DUF882 family)